MPPILFYFANSPAGGGITRLSKYLENIDREDCRYLGDDRSQSVFHSDQPQLEFAHTPPWKRLFDEDFHVRGMDLSQAHVFSHGAPISPKCRYFVLHINNALPFASAGMGLSTAHRLKMQILLRRLYHSAQLADLITVESMATQQLVARRWGEPMANKCQILSNGVDDILLSKPGVMTDPYYLAIGTYSYKQINKAYAIYCEAQKAEPNLKFVVVGALSAKELSNPGMINYPQLGYAELRSLLRYSRVYISMSKIENCSMALLEAIFERRSIICSAIPSHLEFLKQFGYAIEQQGDVIRAEPSRQTLLPPSWKAIAEQTLKLLVP